MLFLNFNFQSSTITCWGSGGEEPGPTACACLVWTDLRGEPVANGVHVVAGRRGAHEGVGVAGEAVAIGRQAVRGAAVGAQASLVHGGRRQGLGSV